MISTRAAYVGGFPEPSENRMGPMLMIAARINQDLISAMDIPSGCIVVDFLGLRAANPANIENLAMQPPGAAPTK